MYTNDIVYERLKMYNMILTGWIKEETNGAIVFDNPIIFETHIGKVIFTLTHTLGIRVRMPDRFISLLIILSVL